MDAGEGTDETLPPVVDEEVPEETVPPEEDADVPDDIGSYDIDPQATSAIIDSETTSSYSYIYASGKLLQEKVTTNGTTETHNFFYDNTGKPYAMQVDGTTYYYITNLQGDVMGLVDTSGNSVASYTYDPYGKLLTATGTLAEKNPLRYRGYYYDSETGFYYLQSRYYDPATRRFVNADAYASTGQGILGINMFAYCLNGPLTYVDSQGTDAILLFDEDFTGHVGALVQDENGTWWHFYWGTEDNWLRYASVLGIDVPVLTGCEEYEGEADLESINASGQYKAGYTDMLYLQGDFSSSVSEMQQSDGPYNLYKRNCTQVTLSTLSHADTDYKDILSFASKFILPATSFYSVKVITQLSNRSWKNEMRCLE